MGGDVEFISEDKIVFSLISRRRPAVNRGPAGTGSSARFYFRNADWPFNEIGVMLSIVLTRNIREIFYDPIEIHHSRMFHTINNQLLMSTKRSTCLI